MVLAFTIIYPFVIAREGFAYKNAILTAGYENGAGIYSGKIQGKQATFTVSADKTVTFQWGDKTYGPYTAKKDSTAIPKDSEMKELMTGVALYCGEKLLFRGGVMKHSDSFWLYNEDGSWADDMISVSTGNGIVTDENGNMIDSMEPSVSTLLHLMAGPPLTHKGEWLAWIGGVLLCVITAGTMLFADELFRWHLSFQIRNAEQAEPSELEIAGRYVTWTVLPVIALVLFIMGLLY